MKYSKDCIVMRFIKKHMGVSLLLAKHLPMPFILPSANSIKIVIDECDLRIQEREGDIGKLIIPLFEGIDFGYNNLNKHSLTIDEIRSGYITLGGEEYVILIRPLKGLTTGFDYNPGVLYKIGSGVRKEDLMHMPRINEQIIDENLLNLIINKKTAYEYFN